MESPEIKRLKKLRKKRRSSGQSVLLGMAVSFFILASLMTSILWIRQESAKEERAQELAQEINYLAERVALYVQNNYSALAKMTYTASGRGMSYFAISCNNNTTTNSCTLPSIKDSSQWHSLDENGYIRKEKKNNNIAGQQYKVVFKAEKIYGRIRLSGILTTIGNTISDDENATIANHTKLPSSYIPLSSTSVKTPHTYAPWLYDNNSWDTIKPGHVTVSLNTAINRNVNDGPISRYGGSGNYYSDDYAEDHSEQTLNQSLMFGTDSSTGKSASICFCTNPSTGGTYAGACAVSNTPTNPKENQTCAKPNW